MKKIYIVIIIILVIIIGFEVLNLLGVEFFGTSESGALFCK